MSTALQTSRMTQEEFLDWADAQEERYEFDGFRPVAMTGALIDHNRIMQNILFALRSRLRGSGCEPLGPDAGVVTIGEAVRYPDALVTCAKVARSSRLVPGVVAVFEVISPSTPGIDRIQKVREYLAVPSIQSYVIVEQQSIGLTLLDRREDIWMTTTLTGDDLLRLHPLDVEIPVIEFYEGTDLIQSDSPAP